MHELIVIIFSEQKLQIQVLFDLKQVLQFFPSSISAGVADNLFKSTCEAMEGA